MTQQGATYAQAGVDVESGERAVQLMRASIAASTRPEVVGDFGGFAGLFGISAAKHMRKPLLATSTDGVGTKIAVARALDIHHTVGLDLVAMVVDDLVVCGAEPLFMTDYIAVGSVNPERVASIVAGIARGCELAGCSLVGGETAEHPGLMAPDEYDIAGAGTGIIDAENLLGPEKVSAGDVVIAMKSSGLHSNGYSLARHVLLGEGKLGLDAYSDALGRTVGEELLEPTHIYALDALALIRKSQVHAFSHVTGGGIAANLARVLPQNLAADVYRQTWAPAEIFNLICSEGNVSMTDAEKTFNMGIGMFAIVPEGQVDSCLQILGDRELEAWVCGSIRDRNPGEKGDAPAKGGGGGSVNLVGTYET